MKTTRHLLLVASLLAAHAAFGDGELAVNTTPIPLDEFSGARLQAVVQLYREGGGNREIAVAAMAKMGDAARSELLAMKRSARDSGEVDAITGILLANDLPEKKPAKTAETTPVKRAIVQKKIERTETEPPAAAAPAVPQKPARRVAPTKTIRSAMHITDPLSPLATRF